MDLLAGKKELEGYYFGRPVDTVGFPLGMTTDPSGFPIFRQGIIASPSMSPKSVFHISFQVLPGDSGSPVFVVETIEDNGRIVGFRVVILGIIASAHFGKSGNTGTNAGLATIILTAVADVVPSTEILEAVDLLPKKFLE